MHPHPSSDPAPVTSSRIHSGDAFRTVAEIARILKLNPWTVCNWIDEGTLPALQVGRRVRVRRSDFEALREGGRTVRTAEPEQSAAQTFWEGRR